MFIKEINEIIGSFIDTQKGLLNWRHTSSKTFHNYIASFPCSKMYPFIITPNVIISTSTNLHILSRRTYVKKIRSTIDVDINDWLLLKLSNLTHLDISYNLNNRSLTYRSINKLTNLIELKCCYSSCVTDKALYKLTNLTSLDCSNCAVTSQSISLLVNLKHLIYVFLDPMNTSNELNIDTSFIENLTNLEYLKINSCVQQNKKGLLRLKKLKQLDLHNYIHPDTIEVLPNLEYLNCGNYEYEDRHLIGLNNLKQLICGHNCYFTYKSFTKLTNLNVLNLYGSKLHVSYDVIYTFINLTQIYCYYFHLPDYVFKNMKNLKLLHCDDNLVLTDKCFEYIPNLTELNCGRNVLFTDNGIITLNNLKTLLCGSNTKLTDKTLLNLPNLTKLNCGFNRTFKMETLLDLSTKLLNLERIHKNNDTEEYISIFRKKYKAIRTFYPILSYN